MSRRKGKSKPLSEATIRLASLTSINKNLDLGNGLTLAKYTTAVQDLQQETDTYNTMLSSIDDKLNSIVAKELVVKDLSERMLAGVASMYGKNSSEYEMAGGVKKSERKKPSKKANTAK